MHRFTFHLCVLAAALTAWTSTARAATSAELVDLQMRSQPVRLVGVADGYVSFFDEARNLRQRSLDRLLAIRMVNDPSTDDSASGAEAKPTPADSTRRQEQLQRHIADFEAVLAEQERTAAANADAGPDADLDASPSGFHPMRAAAYLGDGQILRGHLVDVINDGQTLVWLNAKVGRLNVPIDAIRLLDFGASAEGEGVVLPLGDSDGVVFRNGDRLDGFVQGFDAAGVNFTPASSNQPMTLPWAECQRVELGTGWKLPEHGDYLLRLADGSRVLCASASFMQEQWLFTPVLAAAPSPACELPAKEVEQLDIYAGGRVMAELWQLPLERGASQAFGLTTPVQADAASLRMQAPLRWSLSLPAGARLLWMRGEVDANAAGDAAKWIDFDWRVSVDREPGSAVTRHLSAAEPQAEIRLPLTTPAVQIELTPGKYGPLMDRLIVTQGVVVIER